MIVMMVGSAEGMWDLGSLGRVEYLTAVSKAWPLSGPQAAKRELWGRAVLVALSLDFFMPGYVCCKVVSASCLSSADLGLRCVCCVLFRRKLIYKQTREKKCCFWF